MKAIGFDLGGTLINHQGMPLSWESHYEEALKAVLLKCELEIDSDKITMGKEILSKYNTRINIRENEISSDIIFFEILDKWKLDRGQYLGALKAAFFRYFQQKGTLYEDTILTLQLLKEKDIKIGILTDVPYGMDKEYVLKDIEQFKEYVDIILTSVEVGYRKPNILGYEELSINLGVRVSDMIYVGDEPKDIIGANKAGMFSVLINRTKEAINYGQKKSIKTLVELLDMV